MPEPAFYAYAYPQPPGFAAAARAARRRPSGTRSSASSSCPMRPCRREPSARRRSCSSSCESTYAAAAESRRLGSRCVGTPWGTPGRQVRAHRRPPVDRGPSPRCFYQLDPVADHVLPVQFRRGLLYILAFADKFRRIVFVVPQRGGGKFLELVRFDRGNDAGTLIGISRKISDRRADDEPAGRRSFHDRQGIRFADGARHDGIDRPIEIRHVVK